MDARTNEKLGNEDRLRRSDKLNAVLTGGLVLVTLLSCIVFALQYMEMRESSVVMEKQYDVLKQQTADMHQLVIGFGKLTTATVTATETGRDLARAKITVDTTESTLKGPLSKVKYYVLIKNVGQTIAYGLGWYGVLQVMDDTEFKQFLATSRPENMNKMEIANLWVGPGATMRLEMRNSDGWDTDFGKLNDKKYSIYAWGGLRYDDRDHQRWYMHFCQQFNLEGLKAKSNGEALRTTDCAGYNDYGQLTIEKVGLEGGQQH